MANNSPETVTMLTVPHTFHHKRHILPAEVVITMDSPRLTYYEQQRYPELLDGSRPETRWALTLPFDAAVCLNIFYKHTMAELSRQRYECHSLPPFVWGETGDIAKSDGTFDGNQLGERIRPCDLEAGLPYAMLTARGDALKHEVLGMGTDPENRRHCLNVVGGTGAVAITNILQTLDTFEAQHIYEIRYGAAAAAFSK